LNHLSRLQGPGLRPWLASRNGLLLMAALFAAAFAYALHAMTTGWDASLIGPMAFRQTQTAISAFYLMQGGPWINYETPVLGPPWSIPMEFPFYQWCAALLAAKSGMGLDQAGRAVSMLFFLLCLIPAAVILRRLGLAAWQILFILALWLCSPIYLFWARTFMIESTALFFSLCCLALALEYLHRPRGVIAVVGALFGVLAGLVKITTLYGFALAAACAWLASRPLHRDEMRNWRIKPGTWVFILSFGLLPIAAALAWTQHADGVKALNVSAGAFLTSDALRNWNFGFLEQRSPANIFMLCWRSLSESLGSVNGAVAAMLASLLLGRAVLLPVLGGLLFLIPVLTFTHLHQHHNYYQYAVSLFLIFWVGVALVRMLERTLVWQLVAVALASWIVFAQMQTDWRELNNIQARNPMEVAEAAKALTQPNEVLVITGAEWSSVIPYYSQRRALMDYFLGPLWEGERAETAMKALSAYPLGAAVFCGNFRTHPDRIEATLALLKLHPEPVFANDLCQIHVSPARRNALTLKSTN
jgi:hypothetical protein